MRYFLPLLLLFCAGRANAVLPAGVNRTGGCTTFKETVLNTGGTFQCSYPNAVAGDVVLIGVNFVNETSYSISATETPTCPAALAAISGAASDHGAQVCYITLASNHASFNVTATISTGDVSRSGVIMVDEFAGLGAVDTGSRTAVNAKTTSFTTAGNNEFAWTFASDLCNQLTPSGSNNQFGMLFSTDDGTQSYRQLTMTQTTGNAGSYTSAYTSTNSFNTGFVVTFDIVVAFAISGGHPQSPVYANQTSTYLQAANINASKPVYFQNTLNGSKLVVYYHLTVTNTARACTISTGETCTCLSGSYITHSYSAVNYSSQICYGDMTSAHAGLVEFLFADPGGSSIFDFIQGQEMVGLQPGADTASASGAAALTVNYTDLAAGEWTYCGAGDGGASYPPNLMTPGNSFTQTMNGFSDGPGSGSGQTVYVEGLTSQKVTAGTSGTCSYSMTSSTVPLISVASFTPSPAIYRNRSQIF